MTDLSLDRLRSRPASAKVAIPNTETALSSTTIDFET